MSTSRLEAAAGRLAGLLRELSPINGRWRQPENDRSRAGVLAFLDRPVVVDVAVVATDSDEGGSERVRVRVGLVAAAELPWSDFRRERCSTTPLHMTGDHVLVRALLDAGAGVHVNSVRPSPLGLDLHRHLPNAFAPLANAAAHDDLEAVLELLRHGADPCADPAVLLVAPRSTCVLAALIDAMPPAARSAAVNAADERGRTALHAHAGSPDAVQLLLANGAEPRVCQQLDSGGAYTGWLRERREAIRRMDIRDLIAKVEEAAVKLELGLGLKLSGEETDALSELHSRLRGGSTPLHYAVTGSAAAVRMLVAAGASAGDRDAHGLTPLERWHAMERLAHVMQHIGWALSPWISTCEDEVRDALGVDWRHHSTP